MKFRKDAQNAFARLCSLAALAIGLITTVASVTLPVTATVYEGDVYSGYYTVDAVTADFSCVSYATAYTYVADYAPAGMSADSSCGALVAEGGAATSTTTTSTSATFSTITSDCDFAVGLVTGEWYSPTCYSSESAADSAALECSASSDVMCVVVNPLTDGDLGEFCATGVTGCEASSTTTATSSSTVYSITATTSTLTETVTSGGVTLTVTTVSTQITRASSSLVLGTWGYVGVVLACAGLVGSLMFAARRRQP